MRAKMHGDDGGPSGQLARGDPALTRDTARHRYADLDVGLVVIEGVVADEGRAGGRDPAVVQQAPQLVQAFALGLRQLRDRDRLPDARHRLRLAVLDFDCGHGLSPSLGLTRCMGAVP
nr:hypothetical protein [Nonomuraea sp. WAC 01424]